VPFRQILEAAKMSAASGSGSAKGAAVATMAISCRGGRSLYDQKKRASRKA
jgi:hypothetical protein